MATLEESTWPVGKCRCGAESIIRHSYSMDHGWGGGSFHDQLECQVCLKEWRLEGRHLVHIATEATARARIEAARSTQTTLRREIKSITDQVISRAYGNRVFQNQTREWEEATRTGLFTGALKDFKKVRRGRRFIDVVTTDPASVWFRGNATGDELAKCQELVDSLRAATEEIAFAQASVQKVAYEQV